MRTRRQLKSYHVYQLQHGPNEPLDSAFMKAGVRDRRMHAPGYFCFCSWTDGRLGEQAAAGHARTLLRKRRAVDRFILVLLTFFDFPAKNCTCHRQRRTMS